MLNNLFGGLKLNKQTSVSPLPTPSPSIKDTAAVTTEVSNNVNNELIAYMKWANTFISIVPMPIILIDKKGFVHHTNEHFNALIKIEYDELRCPYVGRFFESATFRGSLETLSSSKEPVVVPMKVKWIDEHLLNKATNSMFEWTMSGSESSEAVVITARPINAEGVRLSSMINSDTGGDETAQELSSKYEIPKKSTKKSTVATTQPAISEELNNEEKEKLEKMAKYKANLQKRNASGKLPNGLDSNQSALLHATSNKWDRFLTRCEKVEKISNDAIPEGTRKSFVNIIKRVASVEQIYEEAGIKAYIPMIAEIIEEETEKSEAVAI